MSLDTAVILGAIISGFVLLFFSLRKRQQTDNLLQIVKMLQQGSKEDRKTLLESLQRNSAALNERLDRTTHVIANVQKNIGEMSEIGRSIKELHSLLHAPKIRGNIGEHILQELLSQFLPKQTFKLQYMFKSGHIVDAALTTTNGIIPIDAKFPMQSFRALMKAQNQKEQKTARRQFETDVKKHIRDITRKYIVPDEGTIDYALMYIPSEAVYYEIANNEALFEYASTHRVLPVSPTTFYAFLKAILVSFQGERIKQHAKHIITALRAIKQDFKSVEDTTRILGKHLTNAYNTNTNLANHVAQMGQRIENIQHLGKNETDKLPN